MKTHALLLTIMLVCLVSLEYFSFGESQQSSQAGVWSAPRSADTVRNPVAKTTKEIQSGRKLFTQLCAVCHGDGGKGDGPGSLALDKKPADLRSQKIQDQSDGSLFWKISTGRAPMPTFKPALNARQRWQLVLLIRALKDAPLTDQSN